MPYTLAEAAVACGLDKSTVRRAVRAGRISGTKDDLGVWHIEPAELHRVFPPAARTEDDTTATPRDAPSDAATDALVAELRAVIADLRQDRDHWREAFQTVQRQLPPPVYHYANDEQPTATILPAIPSEQPSRLRRAWRWIRATG